MQLTVYDDGDDDSGFGGCSNGGVDTDKFTYAIKLYIKIINLDIYKRSNSILCTPVLL